LEGAVDWENFWIWIRCRRVIGFWGGSVSLREDQKMETGFVSVRSGEDFVGVGKVNADGDILFGFCPKERRRKERMS